MLPQYRILERHPNIHLVGEQDHRLRERSDHEVILRHRREITVGICHVKPKTPATSCRRALSNQLNVVDDIGRIRRIQELASGLAA
jgi:hypothetical protein